MKREVVDAERTVTMLLRDWRAGDRAAFDRLMPLVYDELRRLASRHLSGERVGHTFRPTDLVSEVYLKMAGSVQPEWNDRVHFFAIASRGMRQILVDYAHKRSAESAAAAAIDRSRSMRIWSGPIAPMS